MKQKFGEGQPDESVGDFDYQAKLAAVQRDPGKTKVLIGDRYVWVKACEWQTAGRRCRMAASCNHAHYCPWHDDCLKSGNAARFATDMAEFEKWFAKTERWTGNIAGIWEKVNGIAHINEQANQRAPSYAPSDRPQPYDKDLTEDTFAMIKAGLSSRDMPAELEKLAMKYPKEAWIPKLAAEMRTESLKCSDGDEHDTY